MIVAKYGDRSPETEQQAAIYQQIKAVAVEIDYPDTSLEIRPAKYSPLDVELCLRTEVADATDRRYRMDLPTPIGRWTWQPEPDPQLATKVVCRIFEGIGLAEEHERREQFSYKGRRIFNPHMDVALLLDAAADTENPL